MVLCLTNNSTMDNRIDQKYVIQAFDLNLKGRFEVLLKYYGDWLFELPATIVVTQIKDELGIQISEQSIYTLKKRLKTPARQPVISLADPLPEATTTFQQQG